MRWSRRVISSVVSLWLVATFTFFGLRALPGDAIQSVLIDNGASAATIAARRAALGLDAPLMVQYGQYLGGLVRGDLGVSLLNGLPVSEIIARSLGQTVSLVVSALIVALVIAVSLALCAALTAGIVSQAAAALITLSLSTPIYWTGTIALFIFAAQLNWLPSGGGERASQLVLPALVLGFHTSGGIARVLTSGLRGAVDADYVRTSRSKGLRERVIVLRHVLPNALIPAVAVTALQAGFLLGGVVVTESLFARPGLGRELLNATLQQDYPVVQGIALWMAVVYVLINGMADGLYAWIDPRIRYRNDE